MGAMNEQQKNDGWKAAFRSNTTRVGFKLVLTQPMLEFLCAVASDVQWDRARYASLICPDNWLATEHALTRRGFVRRKPPTLRKRILESPNRIKQFCELTPAGVAFCRLLKITGLFVEAEQARERMAKRKGRH